MKLQHFTAVTSVLKILFVLRVMFRVYVYWSGSDTYPVFRTRFSPNGDTAAERARRWGHDDDTAALIDAKYKG